MLYVVNMFVNKIEQNQMKISNATKIEALWTVVEETSWYSFCDGWEVQLAKALVATLNEDLWHESQIWIPLDSWICLTCVCGGSAKDKQK